MSKVITIENTEPSISLMSPNGAEKMRFEENGKIFINGLLSAHDAEIYGLMGLMVDQFKLNTGTKVVSIDNEGLSLDDRIQDYINKMGMSWTVDRAKEEYEKYKRGEYVSFTAKLIIKNVIEKRDY